MRFSIRSMALTSLFAVLTAVGAQIRIPFPFVPMTLHVFFVFLSGFVLGPKYGFLSQFLYVMLGLIGLPVFTSGGGIQVFISPTFGYLIGFIFAAYCIGSISHNERMPLFVRYGVAPLIGLILIYTVGTLGLYLNLNFIAGKNVGWLKVLQIGVFPFIISDVIKGIGASALAWKILPLLKKSNMVPRNIS